MKLYELCGAEPDRLFSAFSWRVRLLLGLKNLSFESAPTPFTQIKTDLAEIHPTVPVLVDGETTLGDSFAICQYVEQTYPDGPSLFGGEGGISNAALIDSLIITGLHPSVTKMIIKDIHSQLAPEDATYFRESREKRLGATLEDVQRGRNEVRAQFKALLKPYRRRLQAAAFLGGAAPLYSDIALASMVCWAKGTSAFDIWEGDPVFDDWFWRVMEICNQRGALKLVTA
ncbi:MAG: glutathione S-transferase N-terminal domain-containing protein [Pseudomonadota bacterium]